MKNNIFWIAGMVKLEFAKRPVMVYFTFQLI